MDRTKTYWTRFTDNTRTLTTEVDEYDIIGRVYSKYDGDGIEVEFYNTNDYEGKKVAAKVDSGLFCKEVGSFHYFVDEYGYILVGPESVNLTAQHRNDIELHMIKWIHTTIPNYVSVFDGKDVMYVNVFDNASESYVRKALGKGAVSSVRFQYPDLKMDFPSEPGFAILPKDLETIDTMDYRIRTLHFPVVNLGNMVPKDAAIKTMQERVIRSNYLGMPFNEVVSNAAELGYHVQSELLGLRFGKLLKLKSDPSYHPKLYNLINFVYPDNKNVNLKIIIEDWLEAPFVRDYLYHKFFYPVTDDRLNVNYIVRSTLMYCSQYSSITYDKKASGDSGTKVYTFCATHDIPDFGKDLIDLSLVLLNELRGA